jgi:hypothetical protein
MFQIHVHLPIDRWLPGFLVLMNAEETQLLYDIPCRGKADGGNARKNNNPERDPTRPWGDLPSGLYEEVTVSRFKPERKTFGPTAILLNGITGDARKARDYGRTGIAIHANRGNDRLMATYGCLRLFDRDMDLICTTIGYERVTVTVFDHDQWPPVWPSIRRETIEEN